MLMQYCFVLCGHKMFGHKRKTNGKCSCFIRKHIVCVYHVLMHYKTELSSIQKKGAASLLNYDFSLNKRKLLQ